MAALLPVSGEAFLTDWVDVPDGAIFSLRRCTIDDTWGHDKRQVLVEADIAGDAMEPPGFYTACEAVATVTDKVGPELAAKHGGRTAFEETREKSYRSRKELIGMYL